MSSRVLVIIGEGSSEKAFLTSLAQEQLGFSPMRDKNCICFRSDLNSDLFWIFPHPSLGETHRGGYSIIKSKSTYDRAQAIVNNHMYCMGDDIEAEYLIITDTDYRDEVGIENLKRRIMDAVKASGITDNVNIVLPSRTIESWFIAGLKPDFPYLNPGMDNQLDRLTRISSDEIHEPKSELRSLLIPGLSGARTIASIFGAKLDIEQAKQRSTSFRVFFEFLEDNSYIYY